MKVALLVLLSLVVNIAQANPRPLTAEEIATAKTWLGEAQLVAEQSFATAFENLGDVWFLSTTELPPKSFVYRIFKGEKELTRFEPSHELCPWSSFDLQAVTFKDFDGNNLADVGVIAQYLTGAGPQGAVPFSVAEIYLNDGKGGFVHDVELHKRLSMAKVGNMQDLLRFARKADKPEKKKPAVAKPAAKREKK